MAEDSKKVWPQWLAALTIHILALLVGLVSGWTSPFLAKLQDPETTESLTLTPDEASWTAALISVTRPLGAVLAAVVVYRCGARQAVLLNGIPHVLAWTCFLVNESVPSIYASRLLSGLGLGMFYSTFPLYIGEISDPSIRGALISLITQGLPIGTLLGNLMGAYVSMSTFAIVGLVLSVTFCLAFLIFPDSPHHLIKIKKHDEAEEALRWYTRQDDVKNELTSLDQFIGQREKLSISQTFSELTKPLNLKILITVLMVYVFMQLSGLYSISLYMELILKSLGVNVIKPSLVVVGVGVIGLLAGLISMYTNDRFGRRTMLAISSFGVSVNLFLLALNFLLLRMEYNDLQWLSIVSIVFYQFFVCVGIMPVPSCLMSEMFAPNLKEIGSCLANMISAVFAFIVSKTYQDLLTSTSEEFVFLLYTAIVFAMFIFTVTCIPETKGKSLQEIQDMLSRKDKGKDQKC